MVKHITFKGEKLPIRLSYLVFKGLRKDLGEISLDKLETMDSDVMETMLWHGLRSGYKSEEKENPFKREQMEDILDECMFEFIEIIPLFFPKVDAGKLNPGLNNPPKEGVEDQQSIAP